MMLFPVNELLKHVRLALNYADKMAHAGDDVEAWRELLRREVHELRFATEKLGLRMSSGLAIGIIETLEHEAPTVKLGVERVEQSIECLAIRIEDELAVAGALLIT